MDMLAALDALNIPFCHLATHSTGGIIAARMLLMQPQRFGRVFALDPVTPLGMSFNADQIGLFRAMMASREVTRAVMATAASSLFVPGEPCAERGSPVPRRARRDPGAVRANSGTDVWRLRRHLDRNARQPHPGAGERRTAAAHAGNPASASGAVG